VILNKEADMTLSHTPLQ